MWRACSSFWVFITLTLFFLAWVLAFLARLAGSSRGQISIGAVAMYLLVVVPVVIDMIASWVLDGRIAEVWMFSVRLLLQVCVVLVVLRVVFRLPLVRMLLPFCAYVGFIFAEYGILVLIVRPWIVDEFRFASRSMRPTLEAGDDFTVNRLLRPRRWDLVAFWSKDAEPEVHCQRLVGLPGERLRFADGALYVNDELVKSPEVVSGRYHASSAEIPPSLALYRR